MNQQYAAYQVVVRCGILVLTFTQYINRFMNCIGVTLMQH